MAMKVFAGTYVCRYVNTSDNILSHISEGKSEMKEEEIRQILE